MDALIHSIERPIYDLLELNIKTLQNRSGIPFDFLNVLKPEEILEKNVAMLIENGQKAMNYMFNVFQIMEHHWFSIYNQIGEQSFEKKTVSPITKSAQLSKSKVKKSIKSNTGAAKSQANEVTKVAKQSKPKTSKIKAKSSSEAKTKVKAQEQPIVMQQQLQRALSSLTQTAGKQESSGNVKNLKPEITDKESQINNKPQ
ncbi:hypothetical protein EP47_00555 [Legionella norrlandica]|uniref:Phasin domain-containing protein n=1 Tax=Legionella norrlandica TaxID=1498499 RepID=A0A0A2STC2_9GAMM|nr:hypothetical protein [Legionella norrlandica]KGP64365.1 hypothetical protein EP47_00555 [Legionella norrlandica]